MSWPAAGDMEGKSWTGRSETRNRHPSQTTPDLARPDPALLPQQKAEQIQKPARALRGQDDYKWDFTNDKLWPITRGLVMETCESGGWIRQCPPRDTRNVSASLAGRLVGLAAARGQDRKWLKGGGNKAGKDAQHLLADLFARANPAVQSYTVKTVDGRSGKITGTTISCRL